MDKPESGQHNNVCSIALGKKQLEGMSVWWDEYNSITD